MDVSLHIGSFIAVVFYFQKEELSQMLAELKIEKEKIETQNKKTQLQLKNQPQKIQIEKKVPPKKICNMEEWE